MLSLCGDSSGTFRQKFYDDLCDSDRDWRCLSWKDVETHYLQTARRAGLGQQDQLDIQDTPTGVGTGKGKDKGKDKDKDKDAGKDKDKDIAVYCKICGPNSHHSTEQCSLAKSYDADQCEALRKQGICFKFAAGKCALSAEDCKYKHEEPKESKRTWAAVAKGKQDFPEDVMFKTSSHLQIEGPPPAPPEPERKVMHCALTPQPGIKLMRCATRNRN